MATPNGWLTPALPSTSLKDSFFFLSCLLACNRWEKASSHQLYLPSQQYLRPSLYELLSWKLGGKGPPSDLQPSSRLVRSAHIFGRCPANSYGKGYFYLHFLQSSSSTPIGRTLVREEVSRHKATPGKSRPQGFRTSLYAKKNQILQWIVELSLS